MSRTLPNGPLPRGRAEPRPIEARTHNLRPLAGPPGRVAVRRYGLVALASVGLVALACREEAQPPPATGSLLYGRHCASCHGAGGRGDGPLAAALKRPPSDLTTLAKRNGGRFDEAAVMAVIDGRRDVAEHGPRDMPVWGAVFAEQEDASGKGWPEYTALLHGRALVDYVRSLQAP